MLSAEVMFEQGVVPLGHFKEVGSGLTTVLKVSPPYTPQIYYPKELDWVTALIEGILEQKYVSES